MLVDRTHILVLNYNGRDLLAECLPSITEAAAKSPVPCSVSVLDNDSSDDSIEYLRTHWPSIGRISEENRGLASFNRVLKRLDEPVVLLLNNDVKLDPYAIEPLLDVFYQHTDAFFSAPLCWDFDGQSYEGMRTRVRSRFGLVQGMSRVPGFDKEIDRPDLTAAAGPVLAVNRTRFLELGGYDPVYFPGRIEDLDLGFRGWMAGFRGYYVPTAVAYHRGFATFGPEFGQSGCDRLAVRNTLIFAWKNLAGPRLRGHLGWLPVRIMASLLRGRWEFARGLLEALSRLGEVRTIRRSLSVGQGAWTQRQEDFFQRFRW